MQTRLTGLTRLCRSRRTGPAGQTKSVIRLHAESTHR